MTVKMKITKKKYMKGGSGGTKQFEVTPIGETGGSSDAQSSLINAKITQLAGQQNENMKFESNLDNGDSAYNLGKTVGGKRNVRKSKKMKRNKSKNVKKSKKHKNKKSSRKSKIKKRK
jgi:hypothetical protein